MRSYFVLTAFSLLGFAAAHAQAQIAPASTPGPRIAFATPSHDFGKVTSGAVVKHDFIFTNTGTATLEILDVKPGCGCTTAGSWDKKVEPGKTGSIPLQLNSTGFSGKITKSATITCNDPTKPVAILQMTAQIWKAIDVTPTMASFAFPAENQTNQTRSVRIVSNLEEPLSIEPPVLANASFQTELKTVRPGKEFELLITAVPPFTTPYASIPIKLKTSAKEMPEISTTAFVSVAQPISISPSQVILPTGPLASETPSTITIRNNTAAPLSLSDAQVSVPGATVALNEAQPGRVYTLALKFPAGFQMEPGKRAEVSVQSNNPKNPVIRVPIYQPVRPAAAQRPAAIQRPPAAPRVSIPSPAAAPGVPAP